MLIASLIPGASYSAGVYSLPTTALATASGLTITASDSVEKLYYALLQILNVKGVAGTLTQVNAGVEASSRSSTTSVWETSANTFVSKPIVTFLATVAFDTGGTVESGNSVTVLTG